MVSPSVGSVILVKFPFTDLSATKLRPAAVLAFSGKGDWHGDWILSQITSNPYADINAVEIIDTDFGSGSLMRTSYVRPGKLFTANQSLMVKNVGQLNQSAFARIIKSVLSILQPPH
ncbi:hypothetical protein [Desulfonatronum thiosulfatophilum]|uniref:hypothetical protein n=1 Tax=Desulfonatronum thiosulfatophilum TaxID=617002 RepID=UPI000B884262|nr:hypothetical protein [Desulfonatronum thiosulfatophilum]